MAKKKKSLFRSVVQVFSGEVDLVVTAVEPPPAPPVTKTYYYYGNGYSKPTTSYSSPYPSIPSANKLNPYLNDVAKNSTNLLPAPKEGGLLTTAERLLLEAHHPELKIDPLYIATYATHTVQRWDEEKLRWIMWCGVNGHAEGDVEARKQSQLWQVPYRIVNNTMLIARSYYLSGQHCSWKDIVNAIELLANELERQDELRQLFRDDNQTKPVD